MLESPESNEAFAQKMIGVIKHFLGLLIFSIEIDYTFK